MLSQLIILSPIHLSGHIAIFQINVISALENNLTFTYSSEHIRCSPESLQSLNVFESQVSANI